MIMAIAEQFAGLDMKQLIGGPLSAAADASVNLADSTADFINRVGFDANGRVRTVAFAYQKRSMNEDGSSNLDEMKVAVPVLAIVPIPNLQVDEVNILFDMEVKQSERSESSLDMGATISGSARIGPVRISVSGSVSSHSSNTRSSDNSAKYHVDVRATNHGTPEGLARVLDMMAANVAPMLAGSSLKDGNGQELSEQARARAEHLKALRQEVSQLEKQADAAKRGLETAIMQIRQKGDAQLNVYRGILEKKINELDLDAKDAAAKAEAEQKHGSYSQTRDKVDGEWSDFKRRVGDIVSMIAASDKTPETLSEMFTLHGVDENGALVDYGDGTGTYHKELCQHQKDAVERQRNVTEAEQKLNDKKKEYHDAVALRSQAALPEGK